MNKRLHQMSLSESRQLLDAGNIRCTDLVGAVLKRIEKINPGINAYITVDKEAVYDQAQKADRRISQKKARPLTGIPLAVKDILCTRGLRTTCASRMLENFIPPYDATAIEKIRRQDAVLIGKTNMDEFSMGSSGETSFFGATRNPWDPDRVPGGSSSGSAAAVAADACMAALGTDTGGSIRQPAAFCGITGFKPSYGRISRFGLVSYASSLDQIGTLTKNTEDAALLLDSLCGFDPKDATSADTAGPALTSALGTDISALTVGLPEEYFPESLDPEVKSALVRAAEKIEGLGAGVKKISLPRTGEAVAAYYIIASAEAGSNLARYDGIKYGYQNQVFDDLKDMYRKSRSEAFGKEVKRRILLGTHVLSAGYDENYYRQASRARTLIYNDFIDAFRHCDLILTPTVPAPAFKIGEKVHTPLNMYLSDVFTIPASLAGLPAISIPCGFCRRGLPIGMQIIGRRFAEQKVIALAHAYEKNTLWHLKKTDL